MKHSLCVLLRQYWVIIHLIRFFLHCRRAETVYEIEGTMFSLIEHPAQILANNTKARQLNAPQKENNDHKRRIALNRVAINEGFVDNK